MLTPPVRGPRMNKATVRTDWQGMILSLLMPAVVVAGLVYVALEPQWNDSDDWLIGIFVLLPLEFVRITALRILRVAYQDYRSPWQAVKFFVLSFVVVAVILLLFTLLELGVRGMIEVLLDPRIWQLILPAALVIIVDGVIALYFFHGNAQVESARLDAAAEDAEDWFTLVVTRLSFVAAAVYAALLYLRIGLGVAVPTWIPESDRDGFREMCLLYVAFYFAGKGVVLAHVHGAHFSRSGRRLLGAGWVRFVLGEKRGRLVDAATSERRSEEKRRGALQGNDASRSPFGSD
jgi:hypothetical protein